ncbi:SGNH/GDSL hydrolase family protein [Nocardia stercoris]|uniref:SGNH/GDSL hydrolase family protein n=1 Tax=Nocardia stercoris TaxID=2483361 RepID=A0A3M2L6C9_9NOCA|nr:SGNH/GDSL hydrolase family protein [Nocardia stercoris]RMI33272.1 SGNH/GDSL hydrolase family protein [Nocardia stercoris]
MPDHPVLEHGIAGTTRPFTRFVALGDSQTEGVGDPDGRGGLLGWADRFAGRLAAADPQVRYANLAVRGRKTAQIRAEQLAPALELRPDLAAVIAGMNDLIRPVFDRTALLADIEAMVAELAAAGARIIMFTYPDIGDVAPIVRPISARVRDTNDHLRELASRYPTTLVDFEAEPAAVDPRVWSQDRLHLNPLGHDLVARAVAATLGLPGAGEDWRTPFPPAPAPSLPQRAFDEARWLALHMMPWIGRRLRGTSSGRGRTAKRPDLLPVAELAVP